MTSTAISKPPWSASAWPPSDSASNRPTSPPPALQVMLPLGERGVPAQVEPRRGGFVPGPGARSSIWPSIYPRLLELIEQQRSTLIFVNSRRLAERLAQRLNELHEQHNPDAP